MGTTPKSTHNPLEKITDAILLIYLLFFLGVFFDVRYLFEDTILTGGDTASWYGVAQHMLKVLLPQGRLSGWDLGNFGGYPNFSFYFIPPFLMATLPSYLFGFPLTITLKLVVMSGIFLLPLTTYYGLRAMKHRFPVPIIGASASLLFLFNESYTMFGGNALSTFAGEFCYMFALALLPWFIGSLYRGMTTGQGAVKNGILLGFIGLCHLFVFIPAVMLVIYWYFARGAIRYLGKVSGVGFGLMAFWILPILAYRYPYTSPVYLIWGDFTNLRHTLAGVAIILLLSGPALALFCLQARRIQNQDKGLTAMLMIFFSALLAFIFFYFLGQYLILGKDLWYAGTMVPDLSRSPLGQSWAAQMQGWVIPISLTGAVLMTAMGLWLRKKKARFNKFCRVIGFLCFMTVLAIAGAKFYLIISRSIGDENLKFFFLQSAVMIPVCAVLVLTAGWFFFCSATAKTAWRHLISVPAPRTFGMYASLICGCVVFYFGAHFLSIPDIRFLPPILLVLIFVFSADVLGGFFAAGTLRVRIAGSVIFCFVCTLVVIFGVAKSDKWFRYNNKGYEAAPGYREFRQATAYLRNSENSDALNAPRVGYEKCDLYGRYGGDRVFESLPVFSGRQTLEGVHYASSMASKYIAFLQTEYSREIKTPNAHILSRINPAALGVHLNLYNVSQLILATTKAKRALAASPLFKREADFGQLSIYRYLKCDRKYVDIPAIRPVLYTSETWAEDFYEWYKRPDQTDVLLVAEEFVTHAEDRAVFLNQTDTIADLRPFAKDRLERTNLKITARLDHLNIRFTTNKVGLPHLIKVSYFPNWQVKGAHGVYPVSPHLMMVIPRQTEVVLTYGYTIWEKIGWTITAITLAAILIGSVFFIAKRAGVTVTLKRAHLINRMGQFFEAPRRKQRGIFPWKELCLILIRSLTPWQAKWNALAIAVQYLYGAIEKGLTFLRPYLIPPVILMALALIVLGTFKRNLPVQTYIEGARNYKTATRLQQAHKIAEAKKYYQKTIRALEKLLVERTKFDQIDIIHSIFTTGACYEKLNQRDSAEAWYQTIISEYPYSRYIAEAYWKIAFNRKYDRNRNLKTGLKKLREGEQEAAFLHLRQAVRQTQGVWESFQSAILKDPYSQWAPRAKTDLQNDKVYLEKMKHILFSANIADDLLKRLWPAGDKKE